jgi:hypothetical protein
MGFLLVENDPNRRNARPRSVTNDLSTIEARERAPSGANLDFAPRGPYGDVAPGLAPPGLITC